MEYRDTATSIRANRKSALIQRRHLRGPSPAGLRCVNRHDSEVREFVTTVRCCHKRRSVLVFACVNAMETRTADFTSAQPLLFSIAYRMLGSVSDAEDIVQDAYVRWLEAPDVDVRAPRAYLATIVTRLAINSLRSARSQRESYVGPWLPEPLVTEYAPDPSEPVELAESLSMAFLVMLERLSPIERAVLLLHDVFDFEYPEIARIIDKSEANCRQLLARAKKHIGAAEVRFDADQGQRGIPR